MHIDNAHINQIVTIKGYGGFAKILSIEEDGVSPNGSPKYRATVKFGPNNPTPGRAKYVDVEDFALGRLEPESQDQQDQQAQPQPITREEILARIAELDKELQSA